jgi:hypothetical protein
VRPCVCSLREQLNPGDPIMICKVVLSCFVASLWACASPGGGGGGAGGDDGSGGGGGTDPGPDATVASHLTLSGVATEQGQSGSTAVAGATIAAYRSSDNMQVATATSDASGNYTLAIDAPPLDGYVKVTKSGYTDTYVYPAAPWIQDATIATDILSSTTFGLLVTFAGGDSAKGVIIAIIVDAGGNPVSGAKIASTPASGVYKYSDGSGTPTGTSSTPADGTAFFLSVPVGSVMVSATKSGTSFHQHPVAAHNGALVTTLISE